MSFGGNMLWWVNHVLFNESANILCREFVCLLCCIGADILFSYSVVMYLLTETSCTLLHWSLRNKEDSVPGTGVSVLPSDVIIDAESDYSFKAPEGLSPRRTLSFKTSKSQKTWVKIKYKSAMRIIQNLLKSVCSQISGARDFRTCCLQLRSEIWGRWGVCIV